MMLTLTRSFLLLLAMLLVAPASYAQSDDEPAEGEEVEEEADVPPEVPRVFKRAKKEFKKKNWALASIGFFSTITKEDEYFHSDARFFLAQCLDQMGLPVSSLEEYNRYFEGADPEDSNIGDALKAAVNLARRLDAGFIIAPGVSRLDTSAVG